MSVRLLAGPFPLRDRNGVQADISVYAYYPHVGLLCPGYFPESDVIITGTFQTHIVSLDGVAEGSCHPWGFVWSWWPSRQRMLYMNEHGSEWVFEPKALVQQSTSPNDQLTPETLSTLWFTRYVKLPDRRIYVHNDRIFANIPGITPDEAESDFLYNHHAGFRAQNIWPGRNETDFWLSGWKYSPATAQWRCGCFYDSIARKIASPLYLFDTGGIFSSTLSWYAPEYGVFITDHHQNNPTSEEPWKSAIRIWSMEVHPTILTDPEIHIGEARSGQIVHYRVQALGNHNDPAEGEFVNWALAGTGTLLDIQSETDEEGYATARVMYQVGESGDSTIEASVAC